MRVFDRGVFLMSFEVAFCTSDKKRPTSLAQDMIRSGHYFKSKEYLGVTHKRKGDASELATKLLKSRCYVR